MDMYRVVDTEIDTIRLVKVTEHLELEHALAMCDNQTAYHKAHPSRFQIVEITPGGDEAMMDAQGWRDYIAGVRSNPDGSASFTRAIPNCAF